MSTTYTFKSNSDKSNAKRFLVKTAKVADFEAYLVNVDGKWGTWMDEAGVPVPFATLEGNVDRGRAEEAKVLEETPDEAPVPPVFNAPVFGAQALAQLTAAPAAQVVQQVTKEAPAGTNGLKIQKDREMRNGVTRYSDGSVGAQLWALFDTVGPTLTLPQARDLAAKHNLNTTSAGISLYSWRRFNGYGKVEKA